MCVCMLVFIEGSGARPVRLTYMKVGSNLSSSFVECNVKWKK